MWEVMIAWYRMYIIQHLDRFVQITQVNWQPITLAMCCQLLHHHVCMHLKHYCLDWHGWLVASMCSLRCSISALSPSFCIHSHGNFSHRVLDLRNIPHIVAAQAYSKTQRKCTSNTPKKSTPPKICINRNNSVSTTCMRDGGASGSIPQEQHVNNWPVSSAVFFLLERELSPSYSRRLLLFGKTH